LSNRIPQPDQPLPTPENPNPVWHFNPPSSSHTKPDIKATFVNNINLFGLEILSKIFKSDSSESIAISPLSIFYGLSMFTVGCEGEAKKVLDRFLHYDQEDLIKFVKETVTTNDYAKTSESVVLSSAAAIFTAKDIAVEERFRELITQVYKGELGLLDVAPVNAFIERETKGSFKDLASSDDIAGDAMYLVTCFYFKGKWKKGFNPADTWKKCVFRGFDGGQQTTRDMMHMKDDLEYMDDGSCQTVILPYSKFIQSCCPIEVICV
jgi:serine protease inhibitor